MILTFFHICLRSRASSISLLGILVTIGFPPREPIDMLYKLFNVLIGPASDGPVGAKSSVSRSPSTSIRAYSVANPRHILVFPTQDIALIRSGIFNSFIKRKLAVSTHWRKLQCHLLPLSRRTLYLSIQRLVASSVALQPVVS